MLCARLEQLGQKPSLQGLADLLCRTPMGVVKIGASMSSLVLWKGSLLCIGEPPMNEDLAMCAVSTSDDS